MRSLALRRHHARRREAAPADFFVRALVALSTSTIPFLVGGAYGLARYLGMDRQTKDLDIFVRPEDIDLIFSSGNAVARVDDGWFEHARDNTVLGVPVKLCPPEEMLWSKAFVQERNRFDGADVLHLLRRFGEALDWPRLVERFGPHWRVLLSHLVLFGFVYPDQRHRIPRWVTDQLLQRFAEERSEAASRVCFGTLLSREQYLRDVRTGRYRDARLDPVGRMTPEELAIWTAAIGDE
jgi:hypothetical protein